MFFAQTQRSSPSIGFETHRPTATPTASTRVLSAILLKKLIEYLCEIFILGSRCRKSFEAIGSNSNINYLNNIIYIHRGCKKNTRHVQK